MPSIFPINASFTVQDRRSVVLVLITMDIVLQVDLGLVVHLGINVFTQETADEPDTRERQ
jgi:hypothetical protein